MEHGKKIKIRRRVAALAGSAAVIAGAIACVPALAHHRALPSTTDSHTRVTVNPPGPHSPTGTIAVGQIGTMAWNLRVESPGTKNCVITGTSLGNFPCSADGPTANAADPIVFFGGMSGSDNANGSGKETFFVSFGAVRADVTSARVMLANGTVLTLRPVKVHGTRWVAFADPIGVPVDSLTVYSQTGEIATSIPFNGPGGDGLPDFSAWLRPGQAGPARFTKTIASGTDNGRAWTVTDYIGPWGTCIASGGGTYCSATTPQAPGGTGEVGFMPDQGSGMLIWGTAADPVSYIVVTLKGGTTIRVGLTAVGQQKYFVFRLSRAPSNADRWTAYDATGKPVKSGSFS